MARTSFGKSVNTVFYDAEGAESINGLGVATTIQSLGSCTVNVTWILSGFRVWGLKQAKPAQKEKLAIQFKRFAVEVRTLD